MLDCDFNVNDLFSNDQISTGLFSVEDSKVFELTPSSLYAEIKRVAESRYQYKSLPENLHDVKALVTSAGKMSLLRDMC